MENGRLSAQEFDEINQQESRFDGIFTLKTCSVWNEADVRHGSDGRNGRNDCRCGCSGFSSPRSFLAGRGEINLVDRIPRAGNENNTYTCSLREQLADSLCPGLYFGHPFRVSVYPIL